MEEADKFAFANGMEGWVVVAAKQQSDEQASPPAAKDVGVARAGREGRREDERLAAQRYVLYRNHRRALTQRACQRGRRAILRSFCRRRASVC